MIDDLDRTLEKLLRERVPMPTTEYEISFETPTEAWQQRALSGNRMRANLYLYEVRENHDLRDPVPRLEQRDDGTFVRRRAPARVDLFYLVTTWSAARPPEVVDEHRLLSALLRTFLRYPILPREYLQGSLIGQEPPLPTIVAQPDGGLPQPPAEFWSAIGNKLRPALNFVVTVAMEPSAYLDTPDVLPPVASATFRVGQDPAAVLTAGIRPPTGDVLPAGAELRSATAGAPAARLESALFASAQRFRVQDGSALRAGEWAQIGDGDDSDFSWVERAPAAGAATVPARPPLRFSHADAAPVRRTTAGLTALTTLASSAAADATSITVAGGAGIDAGDYLLIDDGDRSEVVRVGPVGGGQPAELTLRRTLRFDHPAGAGVKQVQIAPNPPATSLAEPAHQPGTSITLDTRAGFAPAGPLAQGTAVMVGAGPSVEFATLGATPGGSGRTIGVTPPLREDHSAGAAVAPVVDGARIGELNRAAASEGSDLEIRADEPRAVAAGAIVRVDATPPSYHELTSVAEQPGTVGAAQTTTPIGGLVTDDADPPTRVAGARVVLVELGAETRTEADGRFVLPGVPRGTYVLRVTATGYAQEDKTVTVPAVAQDEYRVLLSPA